MEPANLRFGGGPSSSLLHPLVALAMVVAIALILCLPWRRVLAPFLFSILLIPASQQIVLAGLHFNVFRIIILAGLLRWAISRRSSPLAGGFNWMDQVCTALFVCRFISNSLLYDAQSAALIKNAGDLLDALGSYFVMRFLICDREDIQYAIKSLVVIGVVNAICMLNEQRTGADVFALLGGMPEETVRDGKIRSEGAFASFLTAGAFGASLVPLSLWLWSQTKSKTMSLAGICAGTIMAFICYASTCLVACAVGFIGLCFWPIRKHMRSVRWGIVVLLIALHLVMNGPVWSLLEHIDLTGSSSSYHRYMLVDNFIRRFGDWWLLGTKNNDSWGWAMWDTSNEYVTYGFTGGLLSFALFVAVISRGFSRLGIARRLAEGNRGAEWFFWCLGAGLLVHVVAFLGVDYYDQMKFAWLAFLAILSRAVAETSTGSVTEEEALNVNYEVPCSE
jgi:hypothetical protein